MNRYKRGGWYGESHRHYLASKGIKTAFRAEKSFPDFNAKIDETVETINCPNCNKDYQPILKGRKTTQLIQDEFPDATAEEREQLVSGICSNACWKQYLGGGRYNDSDSDSNYNVYQEHGFANRKEYLKHLAEDYDVPEEQVFMLAQLLGKNEDFDGLVNSIQDLSSERERYYSKKTGVIKYIDKETKEVVAFEERGRTPEEAEKQSDSSEDEYYETRKFWRDSGEKESYDVMNVPDLEFKKIIKQKDTDWLKHMKKHPHVHKPAQNRMIDQEIDARRTVWPKDSQGKRIVPNENGKSWPEGTPMLYEDDLYFFTDGKWVKDE